MPTITYAELRYGVEVFNRPEVERVNLADLAADIPVLPFDQTAADAMPMDQCVWPRATARKTTWTN